MIPKDPVMLLSYVNTQLRDNYASLDEFCGAMDVEKEELLSAFHATHDRVAPYLFGVLHGQLRKLNIARPSVLDKRSLNLLHRVIHS